MQKIIYLVVNDWAKGGCEDQSYAAFDNRDDAIAEYKRLVDLALADDNYAWDTKEEYEFSFETYNENDWYGGHCKISIEEISETVREEKTEPESEAVQKFFKLIEENDLRETIESWCGNTRILTISDMKKLAQQYIQDERWWKAKFVIDALAMAKGDLDVVYLFTDNTACEGVIHELQEFRFWLVNTNDAEQVIQNFLKMKN